MASLGHVAVGVAAARAGNGHSRPSWVSLAAWSALSMLPDADVVGFSLGVAYEDPLGHRGASHSLLFAAAVGSLLGLVAPLMRLPRVRTMVMASVVLASHGVLDTLTDGGLGCALFWPFDLTRYFAPWRPIPVAPIGLAFLSPYGAFVSAVELLLFAPWFVFAFRKRAPAPRTRARMAWLGVWALLVWLIGSTDPARQALVGFVLREDTEYAGGYSKPAFAAITNGMTADDVRRSVGPPLEQWWNYATDSPEDCRLLRLANDVVSRWRDFDRCTPANVPAGTTSAEVRRLLGPPRDEVWRYSRSRGGGWFQARNVFFYNGAVEEVMQRWTPNLPE